MAEPRERLAELARRAESALEDGSLASERAVQLRAAEPLIEVLGWDVRGDAVQPETTVGGYDVDYVLTVEDRPAIAVVTESPEQDLDRTAADSLQPLIGGGHTPRGLATDGRHVVALVAGEDRVYSHAFPFEDLQGHTDALGRFHRSTLEAEIATDSDRRRTAARNLAEKRQSVADVIEDEVLGVTGPEVADTVSRETSSFLDELIAELSPDADSAEPRKSITEGEQTDDSGPGDASEDLSGSGMPESADVASRSDERDVPTNVTIDGDTDSKSETTGSSLPPDHEPADDDGSYVARFFGGSSSVGAVGTGSPRTTTVGVVRYLLENQNLRRSVTFPWEVETGTPVVAEQRPSESWIALEHPNADDVYVRPIDDPSTAKAAIEGLAEGVGLRVMFQGDW